MTAPSGALKDPVIRDECGSRRGYELHGVNGERRCDRCREAHRLAMAAYRQTPGRAETDAWYTETRRRALEQLGREFPGRLLEILDEIRAAIPKPGTGEQSEVAA